MQDLFFQTKPHFYFYKNVNSSTEKNCLQTLKKKKKDQKEIKDSIKKIKFKIVDSSQLFISLLFRVNLMSNFDCTQKHELILMACAGKKKKNSPQIF